MDEDTREVKLGLWTLPAYYLLTKVLHSEVCKGPGGIFEHKWRPMAQLSNATSRTSVMNTFRDMWVTGVSGSFVRIGIDGELSFRVRKSPTFWRYTADEIGLPSWQRLRNAVLKAVEPDKQKYLPRELTERLSASELLDGGRLLYDYMKSKSLDELRQGWRKWPEGRIRFWVGHPLDPFKQELLKMKLSACIDCLSKYDEGCYMANDEEGRPVYRDDSRFHHDMRLAAQGFREVLPWE